MANDKNIDRDTVEGFGAEWSRFDQDELTESELRDIFEAYFSELPWDRLPADAQGFDLGCGSGRWASFAAPRVGTLHCIDPAEAALEVARRKLANQPNCVLHLAGVEAMPLEDASMDFGYSIGVLNFVPDTQAGLRACARKLKPGAPFLVYIMYALDNRPAWFRMLWRASDMVRRLISRMPFGLRSRMCDAIALAVYWPLARLALLAERRGRRVTSWPLADYRNRSFYVMRTDALDRFGTRFARRFSRAQIETMLVQAGFDEIAFREDTPYWCAVGIRSA